MDPVTQGLLGASLPQSFAKKAKIKLAAICGALGGMAPDLDVLIRSTDDPLMRIEFHRHFTHSLAFIPIGGLIVALALWLVFFRKENFKLVYIFTTLGFATHGLLDACTSYGTRLLWPFADDRIAWNVITIIDPFFTIPLAIFVGLSIWKKSAKIMRFGILFALLYLTYGYFKHEQVNDVVHELANSRGHKIERVLLNPTIGNNILWRSVYQAGGKYYIDAVRVGVLSEPQIKEGGSVNVLKLEEIYPTLEKDSVLYNDISRFEFFSDGYIYQYPENYYILGDLRYGTLPYDTNSLWGIEVDLEKQNEHVQWKSLRDFKQNHYDEFWRILITGFKK